MILIKQLSWYEYYKNGSSSFWWYPHAAGLFAATISPRSFFSAILFFPYNFNKKILVNMWKTLYQIFKILWPTKIILLTLYEKNRIVEINDRGEMNGSETVAAKWMVANSPAVKRNLISSLTLSKVEITLM
jgi:hypothetical protein